MNNTTQTLDAREEALAMRELASERAREAWGEISVRLDAYVSALEKFAPEVAARSQRAVNNLFGQRFDLLDVYVALCDERVALDREIAEAGVTLE
jgi:hypothetical protein